jgi:hypothetical protein
LNNLRLYDNITYTDNIKLTIISAIINHIIDKFFAAPRDLLFKPLYNIITNIPSFLRNNIRLVRQDLKRMRFTLSHLTASNLQAGIYHLINGQYFDAIFRFKFIDKLLDPGNEAANYWLAWAYFLSNKDAKAINTLAKVEDELNNDLLEFIQDINNITTIPSSVITVHRSLIARWQMMQFVDEEIELPAILIANMIHVMKKLPEEYRVLELGSNIGLV